MTYVFSRRGNGLKGYITNVTKYMIQVFQSDFVKRP